MTEREKQVFDALAALCARREYCTADIRRKALERLSRPVAGRSGSASDPEVQDAASDSAIAGAVGRIGAASSAAGAAGFSPVTAEARSSADAVVSALVDEGYVDDRRYAAAFARDKSALAGWGPVKIRSTLLARGVPREAVLDALGEIDDARAAARLEKVLEAKWRTLRDDPQGRLKLIRFALSRGYDYEPVKPLIERLTRPSDED